MASEKLQELLAVPRPVGFCRVTVVPRAGMVMRQVTEQRTLIAASCIQKTCNCIFEEHLGILTYVQLSQQVQGLCDANRSV